MEKRTKIKLIIVVSDFLLIPLGILMFFLGKDGLGFLFLFSFVWILLLTDILTARYKGSSQFKKKDIYKDF